MDTDDILIMAIGVYVCCEAAPLVAMVVRAEVAMASGLEEVVSRATVLGLVLLMRSDCVSNCGTGNKNQFGRCLQHSYLENKVSSLCQMCHTVRPDR